MVATSSGELREPSLSTPIALGALGGLALFGFYVLLLSALGNVSHAFEQLNRDGWFIGPILIGFSIQVGVFVRIKQLHRHRRPHAALTAASAGTGAASMAACCVHHIGDVLPLLGISALSIGLEALRTPFMIASLIMNAGGASYMFYRLKRFKEC